MQHNPAEFAKTALARLDPAVAEQTVSFNTENKSAEFQNALLDAIALGLPTLGLKLRGIRTNAGNFHEIRAVGDPARGGMRNGVPVATGGSVGFDTVELVIHRA